MGVASSVSLPSGLHCSAKVYHSSRVSLDDLLVEYFVFVFASFVPNGHLVGSLTGHSCR